MRIWEGWWSVLANSFVTGEAADSLCTHPTALWTHEGFGEGWSGCCSLYLPTASFHCGIMPFCLKFKTGFSHWWMPTVSVWSLQLPWLMVDSRLFMLSFQLVFMTLFLGAIRSLFLSRTRWRWLLPIYAYVFHPCDVAYPVQLHPKQHGLYGGQAGSLGDLFVWHLILPFGGNDGA